MKLNPEAIVSVLAGGSGVLESVAWKSLVILAMVALAMFGWRRGAAAARHLAWLTSLLCLLGLPLFGRILPGWPAPDWLTPTGLMNRLPDSLSFRVSAPGRQASALTPVVSGKDASQPVLAAAPGLPMKGHAVVWGGVVVGVWLAGMALGGAWLLAVRLRLYWLSRQLPAGENPDWLELVEDLRRDHRIRQRARLRVVEAPVSPVTWGFLNPVVLLPAEARHWSGERLGIVLRHELAHIRRGDWLTQELAQGVCVIFWFNPLAWLAAGQMRAERERACDDWVLNTGARPSAYAGHLVEVARQFAAATGLGGAVAMARPSGLEQRVTAILDGRRNRRRISRVAMAGIVTGVLGLATLIGGCSKVVPPGSWSLSKSLAGAQLTQFIHEKMMQESVLVEADGKNWNKESVKSERPACQPFFAAAARGDWPAASKLYTGLKARVEWSQTNPNPTVPPGMWWQTVNETYCAMDQLVNGNEKYAVAFARDIINSIPPGSIYLGGTDPGRFMVTALMESQVAGKPFFALTQNALADGTYLDYVQAMYGKQIQTLTHEDANHCFQAYTEEVTHRMAEHKLKPGEDVKNEHGRVNISGRVAVMAINALLVKTLFDNNPNREFYLEESWPLDWMYPNLEPHGLIFKINRQPLASLSPEQVQQDHDYWVQYITPMIGNWLGDDTSVREVTDFAAKVFLRHDFGGFQGDPGFVKDPYSAKSFSKLRSSQADLYVWRMNHAGGEAERERMARAADLAFRQALVLCPYSPEAVPGYEDFLKSRNRTADAALVAGCAAQFKGWK